MRDGLDSGLNRMHKFYINTDNLEKVAAMVRDKIHTRARACAHTRENSMVVAAAIKATFCSWIKKWVKKTSF
jgi:predicted ATP-grasp superfamily ATP-dependent carboligase